MASALRFAIGNDRGRTDYWKVSALANGDINISRDRTGGWMHVSLHDSGHCHARSTLNGVVHDVPLTPAVVSPGVLRLLAISVHEGGARAHDEIASRREVTLVEPPGPDKTVAFNLFGVLHSVPLDDGTVITVNHEPWPGHNAMGTKFVGRIPLEIEEPGGAMDLVVVANIEGLPSLGPLPAGELSDEMRRQVMDVSDQDSLRGFVYATLDDGTLAVLDVQLQYNPPSSASLEMRRAP